MRNGTRERIAGVARDAEVYLVGGTVRDLCLGRGTGDLDLAVRGDARDLARDLARHLGGTAVELDASHGAYRVVWREGGRRRHVDLVSLSGGLEGDLRRRDFTVNAMALPLAAWGREDWPAHLIDPLGGRRDLEAGVLRATGPRSFRDDPVRIVRAARLAAELRLRPDPATRRLMGEGVGELREAAGERVWTEMARMLAGPGAGAGVDLLDETGALDVLFPFVPALREVRQDRHHGEPVWPHCRRTLTVLELILSNLGGGVPVFPWGPAVLEHLDRPLAGDRPRRAALKLAALLHDAGKAAGGFRAPDGHISFRGHERAGVGYVDRVARRLAWARREHAYVRRLVYTHMFPLFLYLHRPVERITLHRFFRHLGEHAPDLLLLSLADVGATHMAASRGGELAADHAFILEMLGSYFVGERRRLPRLVTGHDLQEVLGLPPSPLLGRLLRRIEEAQAAGEIATREQALALARREVESLGCG
ncbi:MAG: CCA tRNA nucleotidyltransferase [Firmicutes bacterium]|nr:CCA tRNA nucleotidyltransferase [Bacillota bacterium]